MEGLKIVEYTPAYAKAVAEMWVRSAEGFNGENCNETEESVLAAHANSTDINTYLAVLGDEVLGYCAFSKYLKDEGALHIRLLNARYDYHGKGIGKALVKKAVERTIELKWPRLDLYTWSANTKAIPLYKKCGYFYENRRDTTHLMNFIPTVINTDAVKDFFKVADWYNDMKRKIDMEPDGRYENGFDFYEYTWEKNGKKLRMEFERRGRGLRLIETDDYMISLSASSQNLVFGRSYKAVYEIINKTGKQLSVEITGRDDKNIKFSLSRKIDVIDREVVEGEFYISEIGSEFDGFKTHPGIAADVVINGKKALFKLGIVPKFPGKVSLICKDLIRHSGESFTMYIDIENYLNEKGIFEFELPECQDIEFARRKFNIDMEKDQIASIPVECRLKKPCIYQAQLDIRATLESGEKIQFKKNTGLVLRGQNLAFGGEINGKYVIVNGIYKLNLDKNYNQVEIFAGNKKKDPYIAYPRLGLPYSDEFSSMPAENVKWYFENGKMILSGDYASNKFENVIVRTILSISNSGIFEHFYEVINASNEETKDEINIKQSIRYRTEGAYIPYDNRVIQDTEPRMEYPSYYSSEKINENWIFSNRDGETESLIWPENLKTDYNGWFMNFEHNVRKIRGGEVKATEPVYLAYSTFRNINEARSFALKSNNAKDVSCAPGFQANINNGNPFANENFNINIVENRELSYSGEVIVKSKNNSFNEVHVKLENEANKITIPIHVEKGLERDLICVNSNFDTVSFERKAHVFYIKDMDFKSRVSEENGLKVYMISNGVMNIKVSPEFSTGIFSLEFDGKEWLDHSFPDPKPRTWYNPWFGGIQNLPEELIENARILLKEHVEMEFVERVDTLGNKWKGIKTSMCYEDDDYKGLKVEQYFLMLPGVPVLLNMTELTNNMNKCMDSNTFANAAFLKIDAEIKNNWVSVKDYQGCINKYRAGVRTYDIYPNSSSIYGCDALEYKIQVNVDFNEYAQWNYLSTKDLVCINRKDVSLAPGQRKLLPNIFYIFTKEHISDKLLKDLRNVRFK